MTEPIPAHSHAADSDTADSDVACDHEWPSDDVAPNYLWCVNCGHHERLSPVVHPTGKCPVPTAKWVPRSPYFTRDNVTILPDSGPPLPKIFGEEADRLGDQLDAEREAAAQDIPPGENAEDCPYCGSDLPYPWICKGHPAAYAQAMDLARGQEDDDRLDAFRVALTRGERWPLDRLTDPMVEVLYDEHAMLRKRNTGDEIWQVQSAELLKMLADRDVQRSGRDHLIRGIRMLADDLTKLEATVTPDEIQAALRNLLGQHRDRVHETSCPEHTRFKVCYCDCRTCRPDGVCACPHCGEKHPDQP
ncbi:hypothetical protein [Streptodolium elevatio]|uniref:Uncharacterized protein n=1 Tax=Streptodolium elevatio TaxID=3157996 RepID=A0ABV3DJZ5_9ACTN